MLIFNLVLYGIQKRRLKLVSVCDGGELCRVILFCFAVEHCHLFPRALVEIIGRYDILELHISLTAGLWRYEQWGYPVVDAAPGVELWAWFKPEAVDVDRQWKELSNSLSGLLCASLNFIEPLNTLSPKYTLQPSGVIDGKLNSSHVRYASLPGEIVCTENLTPWKKLLPCHSKKGLASLLNSGYIHNNRYHSLGLHLRQICRNSDCTSSAFELRQSVSLVYDYLILGRRNWSLRSLFGQGLFDYCPLATTSTIFVDVTSNASKTFNLEPAPHELFESARGGERRMLAKYDVKKLNSVLNIAAVPTHKDLVALNSPPLLHANQYLAGYGQEHGILVHKLYNNYWDNLDVVLLKNIPWYIPIYLHTMSIKSNGVDLKPIHIKYVPGRDRVRPYHLEILLRLPPRSTTVIAVDFDYVFLKWQEYPPDANHGFYIGSSIITAKLPSARNFTSVSQEKSLISESFNSSRTGYVVQIRTESLLITLPTPDFSMPYNVICLACTIVALAFGPLHNITTKRIILRYQKKSKFSLKFKNIIENIKGGKEKKE